MMIALGTLCILSQLTVQEKERVIDRVNRTTNNFKYDTDTGNVKLEDLTKVPASSKVLSEARIPENFTILIEALKID